MLRATILIFLFSAGCATAQSAAPVTRQELRQACGTELQKICAGTRPGDGKLAACMRDNEDSLSASCRATLAELAGREKPS